MSTAKRLVLSLRGRKNSQGNSATSSTRLVSAGTSPGHELDEIAVVSGTGSSSHHFSYGGCLATGDAPLPRYSTGECPPTIHHPTSTCTTLASKCENLAPESHQM
ncbi:GM15609 [Drosophila sechellia]|uniref:GM15609 n=1 Tax=Drosophila sechellia TaxID=7238 RepID=B4I8A8_DROSE|nr:GM15609 [Drosophila sechellia]